MRTVPVTLGGVTYHLLLNGAALFDLYDRFGDTGSLADHLQGGGREAFENTCFFLERLAEQGELWRRYQEYDHSPLPTAGQFLVSLSPLEAAAAKKAVMEALLAGFAREEAEKPGMVDKGLLALQKNGSGLKRGAYLHMAVRFLGLGLREALLLPVGLVFDLMDLESRRISGKTKK